MNERGVHHVDCVTCAVRNQVYEVVRALLQALQGLEYVEYHMLQCREVQCGSTAFSSCLGLAAENGGTASDWNRLWASCLATPSVH